jgi:enoyl-CoA hydratase/carnithine racemase
LKAVSDLLVVVFKSAAFFELRCGVCGKTKINEMEVLLGILPDGTCTLRPPRLIGKGWVMELVLACDDLDAEPVARWGNLKRIDGAKLNMRKFLEIGGQTREGELRMGDLAAELGE